MNIEITANEYRNLLDILHLAEVVLAGHRREDDPRSASHRALIQKLYAHAYAEGLERLISYNEKIKTYVPTEEFEQDTLVHAVIDEFGNHLFWDELINKLSVRDAAKMSGGMERLNALSDDERQAVEGPIRQHYIREFSTNGIANLGVVERFGMDRGTQIQTSD